MSYIEIKDVLKTFHTQTAVHLDRLSFEKSEIVAVIGKNGSGKSTFIKMLAGLLLPTTGDITIAGEKNNAGFFRQIGKFVLESGRGYYDYLTAFENIRYFLSLNRIDWRKKSDRLDDYIDRLDFSSHLHKKVSELSQGNRQKLSLLIALLTDAEIIYLDEPTNGLDAAGSNLLLHFIHRLHTQEHRTVFLTSHDIGFMKNLNMRVLLFKDGGVVLDQSSEDLFYQQNMTKDILEIKNEDAHILQTLQHTKYRFMEQTVELSIYDEKETSYLLQNIAPLSFRKQMLDADDIFYRVIDHVD